MPPSFSGFYIALFLVIATLILRPVGFEFRNKIDTGAAFSQRAGGGRGGGCKVAAFEL
jgi:cytochrome bd-type quinol oxidase subunit 2